MADYNQSIELSFRADLKDLLSKLKDMPGMTKKEASKMVTELQKQLRKSEKAAQQAGKNGKKGMEQLSRGAKNATVNVRALRRDAANLDRLTGELASALDMVHPALGQMAHEASAAGGALEGVFRAFQLTSPAGLALVAAAVAVAGAIHLTTSASKEAEEAQQLLEEQLSSTLEAFHKATEAAAEFEMKASKLTTAVNDARNEYALLTGQIDEYTLASFNAQQQAAEAGEAAKEALEGQQAAEQERLRNVKAFIDLKSRETEAAKAALLETSKGFNSEAQRAALAVVNNQKNRTSAEQTLKAYKDTSAALDELLFQESQVAELEETRAEIQTELAAIQADQDRAIQQQEELAALNTKNLHLKKERKEQAEAQKAAEKAAAEAQRKRDKEAREAEKLAAEQAKVLQDIQAQTAALEDESLKVTLQIIDSKAQLGTVEDQITAKFNKQIVTLQQQKQAKIDQLELTKEQVTTEEQKVALAELERETMLITEELDLAIFKKKQEREAELQKTKVSNEISYRDAVQATFRQFADLTNAAQQLANERFSNDIELQKKLFRAGQVAAIGQVAFNTAEAITAALELPFPFDAIKIAGITATSAAQLATIGAQSPPTADMGMIGNRDPLRPDEGMVRVLKGEAVIDRATVNALGGEQGVRNLQQGSAGGSVVVMQPFKHFDRYIKRNKAEGGSLSKPYSPLRY